MSSVAAGIGRRLPGGRCFCLTFDDAYRDFRDAALPVLQRLRLPATLFVTAAASRERLPGGLDRPLLELHELRELADSGVEIGAHSVGHADLTAVDDAALEDELAGSRNILEHHSGRKVQDFAYPFGRHDARVRAVAGRFFRSAWTTRLAALEPRSEPLALPRIDAHYLRSPLLRQLLAQGRPQPYLRVRSGLRRLRGTESGGS